MYLKEIDTEDMECAFETYHIPDYVLETVPEECRADITGAVYDISYGELGAVYLTESNMPYDNHARYYEPSYWHPAPAAPKSIDDDMAQRKWKTVEKFTADAQAALHKNLSKCLKELP